VDAKVQLFFDYGADFTDYYLPGDSTTECNFFGSSFFAILNETR